MDLSVTSLEPAAIAAGALVLFFLPVIVAAARRVEKMGLVILLTVLGVAGGVTWLASWIAVFGLPRRKPAAAQYPAAPGTWRG